MHAAKKKGFSHAMLLMFLCCMALLGNEVKTVTM